MGHYAEVPWAARRRDEEHDYCVVCRDLTDGSDLCAKCELAAEKVDAEQDRRGAEAVQQISLVLR